MTHTVKTWIEYYEAQAAGDKLFELRKNDRNYNVNDILISQEFNQATNQYTGRELKFLITYVLINAEYFGLKDGYCILGLMPIQ